MSSQAKVLVDLGSAAEAGLDAVAAYEVAIDRICNFQHRHRLKEFISDHHRHIRRLEREMARVGAVAGSKFRVRLLASARVYLAEAFGGGRGILEALRLSEALAASRYQSLLSDQPLSPELQKLLRQDLEDLQRHRDWLAVELHRDERRAA